MKILISLFAVMFAFQSMAAMVIGRVDVQKVLLTTKEGQKVRDQLKKTFEEKQKILKGDEDKIKKMQEDYKKQSLVMNDSAKQKKEEEINKEIMKIQEKSMGFQKEIQEEENKFKKPILDKVRGIVEEVSKSAGVDVTFEASTAPIIYAKDDKDLTDDVIKLYDKKYSK